MPDREKVIKGIQQCWLPRNSEEIETQCVDCPYYYPDGTLDNCMNELRTDAVTLLKKQGDKITELKRSRAEAYSNWGD